MNLKSIDLQVNKDDPFSNCKLDRKKYSKILTSIIDSYSNGFVLGINNKWGTGKTTFIKMWQQQLVNEKYQTVYFNAWENDFENNPLIALMGELKTISISSTEPKFKKTLKRAAILSKHIAPIVAQAIADKYINTQGLKEAIKSLTEGIADVFENEVDEYSTKKKSINDFKKSLSEFIENSIEKKPLVFFIDELDRCRPNYAVSILEQIKHFFSVPNIVFVLSIDKIQLGNAVRGVYGSENIDAEEYLRRFIDLEYSIPEPDPVLFYNYLYELLKFDDFFAQDERYKLSELKNDRSDFLNICKILFSKNSVSLRQQEKIFNLARISLRAFGNNYYVFPVVYLFLNYIKILENEYYVNLKLKKLTLSEMQEKFFEIVKSSEDENIQRDLMWLEGSLLNFYRNYLSKNNYSKIKLFERDNSGQNKLLIKSFIDNSKEREFLIILESFETRRGGGELDLGYLINKIDLLEDLKV